MKAAAVLLAMAACAAGARGQGSACPVAGAAADGAESQKCMYFSKEQFGVAVPAYTIVVRGDGKAMYWETANVYGGAKSWLPVSAATVKMVFGAEPSVRAGSCSGHVRAMGMMSKKTLTAWSQAGQASCTFGSSDDATVSAAAAAFMAMAETLQAGVRVDSDHHRDRLGLERDLDEYIEEVKDGKAIEVQMVAPVLRTISLDDLLIDRVRDKAAGLLKAAAGQ